MSPGKINGPLELVITHLKDFDSLLDFTCGIPEMDAFIRSRFTLLSRAAILKNGLW